MLRDGWVSSQVDKLLDHCRRAEGFRVSSRPEDGFRQIDPPQARKILEDALAATDAAEDPPVSDTFAAKHAFIRARIRALPPAPSRGQRARRPTWTTERRALLAAEFLASDEAEELSDLKAASRIADLIINFGCDQDSGRPLRMSPAKVQNFMLAWLPRKVLLSVADQNAMPHAVKAWIRWSGRKGGLSEAAIGQMLDVLFDSMATFTRIYRDPAEFGLNE